MYEPSSSVPLGVEEHGGCMDKGRRLSSGREEVGHLDHLGRAGFVATKT